MSKDKPTSESPEDDETTSEKLEDAVVFEADPGADSAHLASPAPAVEADDSDVEADTDAVQIADAVDASAGEVDAPGADEAPATPDEDSPQETADEAVPPPQKPKKKSRIAWFGLFNFILILLLAGAAGWYWWQQLLLSQTRTSLTRTYKKLRLISLPRNWEQFADRLIMTRNRSLSKRNLKSNRSWNPACRPDPHGFRILKTKSCRR